MRLLDSLRFRFAALFQRAQTRTEIEEELRAHIELRADDLVNAGMARKEAERRARIEFGATLKYKDEIHRELGSHLFETLLQDIRFSLRALGKSPGFTLAAVFTLALAIGANAVVFSILNGVLLRPLSVPDPKSLYALQHADDTYIVQSYPDYIDLRDHTSSFNGLAAYTISAAAFDTGQNPSIPWIYEVSGNYFDTLEVQPELGRVFHAADEHGPNSAPYIVLGHAFWQSRFQGDPGVIGRVVRINKHPFTIIGVTPATFGGTLLFFSPDFYTPMVNSEQIDGISNLNNRRERWVFEILGHLKPGVTPAQAVADLNNAGAAMEKANPKDDSNMTYSLVRPGLHGDFLAPATRGFLSGLMVLSTLILLAACANLGSLFAARAADRSREVALRLALGSSRNRILRGVFTESILISIAGGVIGVLGSFVLLRALSAWQPFPRFPIKVPVEPDANVYLVALLLTIASGFLFALVPVRQVLRTRPYEIIKSGGAGLIQGRTARRMTLRDVLLVVQIAICAVLVTSSVVAVRGLMRSLHSNFGFDPENVLLVNTDLAASGYPKDTIAPTQRRLLDVLDSIHGVNSVAMVGPFQPLTMGGNTRDVFTDGATDFRASNAATVAYDYNVSPGYFRAAGTAILAGRDISWHDDPDAPRVGLVNRQAAVKLFGSMNAAMGNHFKLADGSRVQIVGIVEDGKYFNLAESPESAIFLPILQEPTSQTWAIVRPRSGQPVDPEALSNSIRAKIRDVDAELPVYIQPWAKEMDGALFASRVATVALGVLGGMGVMLALTGIFGMAAYSVSRRIRELGIRMALGASRVQVLRTALNRPLQLLLFGSIAGLTLGLLATRILASIVYQATPRDPIVLAAVLAAMSLLGLFATWIPAQRALSVNPLILLREE
jgi:predicted permease